MSRTIAFLTLLTGLSLPVVVRAHEHSRPAATERERRQRQSLLAQAETDTAAKRRVGRCQLVLDLRDAATGRSLAGNIQIVDVATKKPLALTGLISRPEGWFAAGGKVTVSVPQSELVVSAFQGLETAMASQKINLQGKERLGLHLHLRRIYNARARGLASGNTHLHLNRISRKEADRYLTVVPRADDLDLLYVSHLERAVDDESYVTNEYDPKSLAELSSRHVTLRYGQEHRHNFEAYGEGYGHVMLLDINRLIQPVSIGPGLMQKGTDGRPLREGIERARRSGATVIWCHNRLGIEDLPNWVAGVVHAQNIFDGGSHGSYDASFYRYLNIGLKVPFSTGTDWFIYDLSRVLVPVEGAPSSQRFLRQLARGRSAITNGPFLEFSAGSKGSGGTIQRDQPGDIWVSGRGIGRCDFRALELIHNGKVVHSVATRSKEDRYEAEMKFNVALDGPGWLALRIPLDTPKNEFGHTLFAHTSPIYIEMRGKRIYRRDVAQGMLVEMERNLAVVKQKGVFANDSERDSVLQVHRQGITKLQELMQLAGDVSGQVP